METETLEKWMRRVNNFFEKEWIDGRFEIRNGRLLTEGRIGDGELIYVSGSRADGLTRAGETGVYERDEVFEGRVWICRPDRGFMRVCEALETAEMKKSPEAGIAKERFGDYSVERESRTEQEKRTDAALRPWRRMYSPVG